MYKYPFDGCSHFGRDYETRWLQRWSQRIRNIQKESEKWVGTENHGPFVVFASGKYRFTTTTLCDTALSVSATPRHHSRLRTQPNRDNCTYMHIHQPWRIFRNFRIARGNTHFTVPRLYCIAPITSESPRDWSLQLLHVAWLTRPCRRGETVKIPILWKIFRDFQIWPGKERGYTFSGKL